MLDRGLGFESLVLMLDPKRTVAPLPGAGPLFRISAGLEDAADLIGDLEAGFDQMRAYLRAGA